VKSGLKKSIVRINNSKLVMRQM